MCVYARIKLYLFVMGERPLYSWRMESRIRKARRDPLVDKYGRGSQRYRSDNRRMPYEEQSAIIGDIAGKESCVGGVFMEDGL